jgi:hypothetical protein
VPGMTRVVRRYAYVMAIALLGVVAASAEKPDVQGSYILDTRASDDVHKAIDEAVVEMSGLRRPFARLRLREVNQPPQRIDVAITDTEASITTDERDVIRTPTDGKPVAWKKDDGEEFTIRTTWDRRTLKRTFHAEDGERANTYEFTPDASTLTMRVVLTSPQLPAPLAYTLVYRRAAP